jgi:Nucleotidyltransferase
LDIRARKFLGHHKPPAAHYRLTDPGRSKATQSVGGITSQNLRYVEVLLARPWSGTLSASNGFPLANDTRVQIANPVSFLAQKILIHGRRNGYERAKDILYMHDTIETFATRIDELQTEWITHIRDELHPNSIRTVQRAAASLFGAVTDPIRSASRIIQGRALPPEAIRETCSLGFTRVLGETEREK